MKGPRSKSCWAKMKIDQDKGHIEVRIDQYQGHVGADIKVILGAQDEGQYGFGHSSWVKMKAMLGVQIGQHQGHEGADIKVKLEGPY